jgi:hypothetical protein
LRCLRKVTIIHLRLVAVDFGVPDLYRHMDLRACSMKKPRTKAFTS